MINKNQVIYLKFFASNGLWNMFQKSDCCMMGLCILCVKHDGAPGVFWNGQVKYSSRHALKMKMFVSQIATRTGFNLHLFVA
jgi:hypothetical protein